jgi:hypothetical protein
MDSPEDEVTWLQTLSASQRAQFLLTLSHGLTIAGRFLALSGGSADARLERLRLLNEIQHCVVGYAGHVLREAEDERFLLPMVRKVLCWPTDADLIAATRQAWRQTRTTWTPV